MLIADAASSIFVQSNSVIYQQGQPSSAMYFIVSGKVGIEKVNENGEKNKLAEYSEYEVFNDGILSDELHQVTAIALVDCELLIVDRSIMLEIVRISTPEETMKVFLAMSKQMRATFEIHMLAAQMEAEKQRALTEMVAGVAHEINTPLGIINTAVNIMARELAAPKEVTIQRAADIAESLELMRRNVERTHKLVQDFQKISVSHLMEEKELLDISLAVEDIVSLVLVNLKRSQIGVNFFNRLTFEQKGWVGYRGVLSQILINLLTNAERHEYPIGVRGAEDVTIELADEKNYCLTVQDYGKGIPKENQTRVFEPFFTTARSVGGTGLGLAIVHNLVVNVLKGKILLRSEQTKGTAFQIIIPRVLIG